MIQQLTKVSDTCEVACERIVDVHDENENMASPTRTESYFLDSIEIRKRKRDPSADLELKRPFRVFTLMRKAPWAHPPPPFIDELLPSRNFSTPLNSQESQHNQSHVDMDDTSESASAGDVTDREDLEPPSDEDLAMMFDWPDSAGKMEPVHMVIEAPGLKDAILQVPEIVKVNRRESEMPRRVLGTSRSVRIWTCVSSHQYYKRIW